MKTLVDFRGDPRVIVAAFVLGLAALFGAPQGAHAADCSAGKSMSVIAHPDDDLLFQSPDILHDLRAGKCMESIYLTAGDAGQSLAYAAQRRSGVEAAYAEMAGVPDSWSGVSIDEFGHISQAYTLRDDPKITLRFLSLPDGNPLGSGFAARGYQSLEKLWNGDIPYITTIDGSENYSKNDLTRALATDMDEFQPDLIRTLNFDGQFGANYETHSPSWDHSDHLAAARFALEADHQYDSVNGSHTIFGYIGSGPGDDKNVSGADLLAKQAAFYQYGSFDPETHCASEAACMTTGGEYPRLLRRQIVVAKQGWTSPAPTPLSAAQPTTVERSLTMQVEQPQPPASAVIKDPVILSEPGAAGKVDPNLSAQASSSTRDLPLSVSNSPPGGGDADGFIQHVWASMRRN